jgi:hypothetical protein
MQYHALAVLLVAVFMLPTAFQLHHTTRSLALNLENPTLTAVLPSGPDDFPEGVSPLTGLPVADPAALTRSPLVVKVSNAPPLVRPQAGIGLADLVFEHYAEGGLTRFSAIFHSQTPPRVGSIRSARLIDYELLPMYQGLLVFSGASIGVEDRLNQSEYGDRLYKGVLYGLPYFWRDETIPIPHNMFANLAALHERAVADGVNTPPDLHGMAFDPQIPAGGQPASRIDLRYRATRVGWDYDADSGLYRRSADGLPHYDAHTNEQISAANVVVLYAEHILTDIIESQWQGSVSYSTEIKLWFEGDALLFRDGQQYPARWLRPTRQDLIALRTPEGEFLHFKPGQTWFQVVPLPEQQNPAEEWLRVE